MPKFRENPSLTTSTTQNLSSAFNLCEFVPTCKKSGYLTDFFWRYGWLKNPAFWLAENILAHISGTKIWDLCRNTANNINFHYRSNSVKMMTKFSNKLKKKTLFLDHFGTIFPILGAKFFSPENPSLSHTTSHGILAPCQNSEKTYATIPRKCPDRWKGRTTDRPYFIGPFRLLPGK